MRSCNSGIMPFDGWGARMACSGGCGEIYVDEYLNHPPVCDPCGSCRETGGGSSCDGCGCGGNGCDTCGCSGALTCDANYVGYGCQPQRPALQWLSRFWGIPYNPSNCGNCGAQGCHNCQGNCRTCQPESSAYSAHHQPSYESQEVYEGSLQPVPQQRAPMNAQPQAQPQTPPQARPQNQPNINAEEVPAEVEKETRITPIAPKISRLAPAQQKRSSSRLVTQ